MTSWCVSIAYVLDGRVEFGFVLQPRAGRAVRPAGAGGRRTLNGRPIALHPGRGADRRASSRSATRRASAPTRSCPSSTDCSPGRHVLPQRLRRARPLLRRLRPAARLRRAAHQLLGLPRRHRGGRRGRRADERLSAGDALLRGNRIVAGPPAVYEALDEVLADEPRQPRWTDGAVLRHRWRRRAEAVASLLPGFVSTRGYVTVGRAPEPAGLLRATTSRSWWSRTPRRGDAAGGRSAVGARSATPVRRRAAGNGR